jgi:hypothetical protein
MKKTQDVYSNYSSWVSLTRCSMGGIQMTVASQIKQTLASLKGAEATIKTYAIHHPDQVTKGEFLSCEQKMKSIISDLEKRIQQIEYEEPQFKGL